MTIIPWLIFGGTIAAVEFTSILGMFVGSLFLGSLAFWAVLAVASAVLFAYIEHDDGAGATGTLLAFLAFLHFFGDLSVVTFAMNQPVRLVSYIALYFVLGTAWSVAKWWFYVRQKREDYDEAKNDFIKNRMKYGKNVGLTRADAEKEWPSSSMAPSKPIAAKSKDMILRWMTFWPWSMLWTLINDPIKKAFRAIYKRIQGVLQAIADKAWEGA